MHPDTSPSLRRPSETPLPRRVQLSGLLARVPVGRLIAFSLIGLVALVGVNTVLRARQLITSMGPTAPVPIARGPIEAGAALQADDIHWQDWPQALAPPGSRDLRIGDHARTAIAPGEPILASAIGAADDIARHERLVSIPIEGDAAALSAGQHVDLHGITMTSADQDSPQVQLIDLGPARITHLTQSHVQIAVDRQMVPRLLHTQAIGVIELVAVPTP